MKKTIVALGTTATLLASVLAPTASFAASQTLEASMTGIVTNVEQKETIYLKVNGKQKLPTEKGISYEVLPGYGEISPSAKVFKENGVWMIQGTKKTDPDGSSILYAKKENKFIKSYNVVVK